MKECSKKFIDVIISEVSIAPDDQINEETRSKITRCTGTYGEKYDIIVGISKLDATEVSFFIKEVCALDKYYLRPTDCEHPLTNEKTFSDWLSTLCCRNCVLLKDNKCTHETAEEQEAEKDWMREDDKKRGKTDKNVTDYFVCDYFDDNFQKN